MAADAKSEPQLVAPSEPAALEILDAGRRLGGASSRYEKRRRELAGLYRDGEAYARYAGSDPEALAYWVDESRIDSGEGALIIGLSVLAPDVIGHEYAMTRGHLHAKSSRAELYFCVGGRGVLLMDDLFGQTRAVELVPGKGVHVPGEWVHRSVNVGTEPFSMLFCYDADSGQNYGIIHEAGGMRELIVTDGSDGWKAVPNDRHIGYRRGA
jgi:glucose-6-phosphate isomerase